MRGVCRRAVRVLALAVPLGLAAPLGAETTELRSLNTRNDARAFEAVGRIDAAVGSTCTGTLIAADLVLTAAHCVYHPDTAELIEPRQLTFSAGLTNGRSPAVREVAQVVAHDGFIPGGALTVANVANDVALLRLDREISPHEVAPFSVASTAPEPGTVSVVSYGRGRSEVLSRQSSCQILARQGPVIAMDCDVTFGSSGAPVFSHQDGRGRVIAVVSGMGRFGDEKVSYGMDLTAPLADLKARLRADAPRPRAVVRRLTVGQRNSGTGAKFVRP